MPEKKFYIAQWPNLAQTTRKGEDHETAHQIARTIGKLGAAFWENYRNPETLRDSTHNFQKLGKNFESREALEQRRNDADK